VRNRTVTRFSHHGNKTTGGSLGTQFTNGKRVGCAREQNKNGGGDGW
jgi:hypothetical protein